jgi:hypothetical protein
VVAAARDARFAEEFSRPRAVDHCLDAALGTARKAHLSLEHAEHRASGIAAPEQQLVLRDARNACELAQSPGQ